MSASEPTVELTALRAALRKQYDKAEGDYNEAFRVGPLGTFDLGLVRGIYTGARLALEAFDAVFPRCSGCGGAFRSIRVFAKHRSTAPHASCRSLEAPQGSRRSTS